VVILAFFNITKKDYLEVINALAGSVRWTLDLMAWLVDTLITLPTTLPQGMSLTNVEGFSLPDLHQHVRDTNMVSLHLLLSSSTRGFLTAICRRLIHLDWIARKAIAQSVGHSGTPTPNSQGNNPPSSLSPALRNAYLHIATLVNSTILRIKTMETLLGGLTTSIKDVYGSTLPKSQPNDKARNALEIKMLFGGEFPEAFKPVIVELFKPEGLLEAVREDIEPAKLFFADFSLLEVNEDKTSLAKRKASNMTMDCFRKNWLPNPKKGAKKNHNDQSDGSTSTNRKQLARWRRCARCAAVIEDVLTERRALQWLIMQQRRCFCGGYWDTLSVGEMVA
jgi:mediator of RNA polymerase II transcription subunit 16